MTPKGPSQPDADLNKGAVEDNSPKAAGETHNRLSNQLPHRDSNEEIKDNDSDFPEPGSSPEHS